MFGFFLNVLLIIVFVYLIIKALIKYKIQKESAKFIKKTFEDFIDSQNK